MNYQIYSVYTQALAEKLLLILFQTVVLERQ